MKKEKMSKEEIYSFIEELATELNVFDQFKNNLNGKESIKSKLIKVDLNYKPKQFDLFDKESLKRLKERSNDESHAKSEEPEVETIN